MFISLSICLLIGNYLPPSSLTASPPLGIAIVSRGPIFSIRRSNQIFEPFLSIMLIKCLLDSLLPPRLGDALTAATVSVVLRVNESDR